MYAYVKVSSYGSGLSITFSRPVMLYNKKCRDQSVRCTKQKMYYVRVHSSFAIWPQLEFVCTVEGNSCLSAVKLSGGKTIPLPF